LLLAKIKVCWFSFSIFFIFANLSDQPVWLSANKLGVGSTAVVGYI
jgi:hypothetical protein